ncbi:MAG: 50S ribosomal protein L5 [Candidatus Pacebacteria bacterium]|nr:50S ribosomal protein L5 [Candidatus Paceibacterota bacterium]
MNSLQEKYNQEIISKLKEKFSLKNTMVVPRVTKVVVNVGFGRFSKEKEHISKIEKALRELSGQKPVFTKAKKSISAFKLREGMIIGAMVTLRKERMYDFVEKLVSITFPRVRDFRGLNTSSIDQAGNLNIGFKEHTSFPEIGIEDSDNVFSLEATLVTNTKNREQGLELFKLLGFPFKK